jgi:hypothetical protein
MFNLIIVLFLALVGSASLFSGIGFNVQTLSIIGIVLLSGSGLWFLASVINTFATYSCQLERFEKLQCSLNNLSKYKLHQANLLTEFKLYLGEKYPELEKELFKNISDNSSEVNIVLKYPEIQSSKTLLKLTEDINVLVQKVYSLETEIEEQCARIRYYKNGKWEYIVPKIPEKLQNIIYSEIK